MTPNSIEFRTTPNELHNTWVMRITADKRIEVNEGVEVTETAKKVLEAMQWMLDKQKRTWQGLTDEQFLEACQMAEAGNYMVAFQRIQQWLKESNT